MTVTANYSLSDISEHNSKNDVWIIVEDKVYDVTKYLDDHPGGEEIILDIGGRDATALFEDAGHSDDAQETREKFLIGNFSEYQPPPLKATYPSRVILPPKTWDGTRKLVGGMGLLVGGSFGAFEAYKGVLNEAMVTIRNRSLLSTSRSFWMGVTASLTLTAVITAVFGYEFQKTLHLIEDMSIYPAHKKPRLSIRQGELQEVQAAGVLDAREYRNFPLLKKQQLSHNVYRFVFGLPHPSDTLGLPIGQHIVIRGKVGEKFVERSYTPTSSDSDLGRMELTVKVYPSGKIGNYLLNLPLNSLVSIKGRAGRSLDYRRCDDIGCIAGGTGITPIYQLIRAICDDPTDKTKITLLYANEVEDDILMLQEMNDYASRFPDKFKVYYILKNPPEGWKEEAGFVTQSMIERYLQPPRENCKYLVCGPPPMVVAMKKNLAEIGCKEAKGLSQPADQVYFF